MFLIANKNICARIIVIANNRIILCNKLRDTIAIIIFINAINNLYINKYSNNYRTKSLYLLKLKINIRNYTNKLIKKLIVC